MPVREDILNFMRSLKAGKQAVKDNEATLTAMTEAQANYEQSLETYATQLTAYESELPQYEQQVADWQQGITDAQAKYESDLNWYYGYQPAISSWAQSNATRYPGLTADPKTWSDLESSLGMRSGTFSGLFLRDTGYDVNSPPVLPSQPTAATKPEMLNQHPGDMPDFEFKAPESSYSDALFKSVSPSSGRQQESKANQYYSAVQAQAQTPSWWEKFK